MTKIMLDHSIAKKKRTEFWFLFLVIIIFLLYFTYIFYSSIIFPLVYTEYSVQSIFPSFTVFCGRELLLLFLLFFLPLIHLSIHVWHLLHSLYFKLNACCYIPPTSQHDKFKIYNTQVVHNTYRIYNDDNIIVVIIIVIVVVLV